MSGKFARKRDDGLIEIIDEKSGRVVGVTGDDRLDWENMGEQYIKIKAPDGKDCYIQKGINPDKVLSPVPKYEFSWIIADIVCQRIVEGERISSICKDKNIPSYGIISRWRRENTKFDEALKLAQEERAELFHDKAIKVAEESKDKNEVANDTLKVNTYKWAAGVGNPDRFGNKTKLVGDKNAPLAFVLDTGIRRKGDEGYNKDECLDERDVTPEVKLSGNKESSLGDIESSSDIGRSGHSEEAND